MGINKNGSTEKVEVQRFLNQVSFLLPDGFIEFYEESNGADIIIGEAYTLLWPLTEMVQLNADYDVDAYAPDFFIFGSDGGDMAFAIEKSTGYIFDMPFIGMSKEEAVFRGKTFKEFLESVR